MRVFVTGGSGFIGSVVVRLLLERGYRVRCLLRPTSRLDRLAGLGFESAPGDLGDPDSLLAGMRGCQAVVHLAGLSSWSEIRSPLLTEVVVAGTGRVLAAARAAGGLRTVYVSSSVAVAGSREPLVHQETSRLTLPLERYPYAHAKQRAEALCQQAAADGLPVTIVNPCEVYGPNDSALITAGNLLDFARSWPVLVCSGGTSVVHVDDVAEGIVAALERGRPGRRYILGGDNLTVRQLAALTLDLLGLSRPIVRLPNGAIQALAAAGRWGLPLPFDPEVIPYATLFWFMDNTRARTELGLTFRSARETLAPTLAWLQQTGRLAADGPAGRRSTG
jgi:dihydroflavonol-4-reductase